MALSSKAEIQKYQGNIDMDFTMDQKVLQIFMLDICMTYLQRHLLYYEKCLTYIKNYFRCCFANMLL